MACKCATIMHALAHTASAPPPSPACLPRQGGLFSLYNGSVQGVFREAAPNQRILMDWRFRSVAFICTPHAMHDRMHNTDGGNAGTERLPGSPGQQRAAAAIAPVLCRWWASARAWRAPGRHRHRAAAPA